MIRRRLGGSPVSLGRQLLLALVMLGAGLVPVLAGLVLLEGPVQVAGTRPSGSAASTPSWNTADATYVQAMVWHHLQARDMAGLVAGRTTRPELRSLARTMHAAQSNDVVRLAAWLRAHGHAGSSDAAGHRLSEPADRWFAGMMAPPQLRTLASTTGQWFDFLFVDMLIEHHRGAMVMADEVLADGCDVAVAMLAKRARAYAYRSFRQLTGWRQRWAEPFLRELTRPAAKSTPASS